MTQKAVRQLTQAGYKAFILTDVSVGELIRQGKEFILLCDDLVESRLPNNISANISRHKAKMQTRTKVVVDQPQKTVEKMIHVTNKG